MKRPTERAAAASGIAIRRYLAAGFAATVTIVLATPRPAFAQTAEGEVASPSRRREAPDAPLATKPGYVQVFATALVGAGLRFNNPYRLATPLGDDAESVSLTAPYLDLGAAGTFIGDPLGVQHGLALRMSVAVSGVRQSVFTPSYFVVRRWSVLALHGRAGIPIVLSPDLTTGLEAAAGGTWFVLGGIGVTAELIGDLFYGAGTGDVATVTYPVLSAQIGVTGVYEVLP